MVKAISMLKTAATRLVPERAAVHLRALDHYWRGEPEVRLLRNIVPRGRRAVDAGANIGTYTYFLQRLAVGVYAYEPNPNLAAMLRRLFPDVVVRQVALSDHIGRAALRVPVEDGRQRHELASIAQSFDSNALSYSVEVVTLDSEDLTDIGFLKVDVEQNERNVLRGAQRTIERWRPVVLTEVSPLLYEDRLDRVFGFLTDLDYRGWFRFGGRFLPLTAFEPSIHANRVNWGNAAAFMGTNMLFVPTENPLSGAGPGG